MNLQNDLREFIALLNSRGVEYLIVGGHAVAFHGYPRFTGDIDILFRPSRENIRNLLAALDDFGFEVLTSLASEFERPGTVVQIGVPPNRVDLLNRITGVDFDAAWNGRVASMLDGLPVAFIGLDEMLRNKEAAGRDKDAVDLARLREVAAKSPRRGLPPR